MRKDQSNLIGKGTYNSVYRNGDKVVKIPEFVHEISEPERNVRIGKEIYPELKFSIEDKGWSMPFMEKKVETSENDRRCAEEILGIFKETGRIPWDGCGTDNFRADRSGKLYLVDYDLCFRRGSIASDKHLTLNENYFYNDYWRSHEDYGNVPYTVGIIKKLVSLDKILAAEGVEFSEIKKENLTFENVCAIQEGRTPMWVPQFDRTWQRAHNAAQGYLNVNEHKHTPKQSGVNQTYEFLEKLKNIKKTDSESVEKEVRNWIQGYGIFGRKSTKTKNSREGFARLYGFTRER